MTRYDFVIIGSGPPGARLASKLASAQSKPSILLLEAGGDALEKVPLAERFLTVLTQPHLGWGDKTVSQKHLDGRELDYPTGKALGGSTNINYGMWTTPSKAYFDEWAQLVGDDFFGWENARRHLDGVEHYEPVEQGSSLSKFVRPRTQHSGHVPLFFSSTLSSGDKILLDAFSKHSSPSQRVNLDVNSGDPIGVGIIPAISIGGQYRATAAEIYLKDPPVNLTIKKNTAAVRVILENSRAVGVETTGGETYYASKDIILSCGALQTPKLLMLSGIGPQGHLAEIGIECVHDLPGVGSNFRDHSLSFLTWETEDQHTETDARNLVMSWHRDPAILELDEIGSLSVDQTSFLAQPTAPTYEAIAQFNFPPGIPHEQHNLSIANINIISQSTGTVRLASRHPADNLVIDPNFLSHPLDQTSAIVRIRAIMKFVEKAFGTIIKGPISTPESDSDKDIEAWSKKNIGSGFHPSSTAKIGSADDDMACVDSNFEVRGVKGLRVVDLSVCPFSPDCHTTSVGYLLGSWAAEKIRGEYNL